MQVAPSVLSVHRASPGAGGHSEGTRGSQALGARRLHGQKGLEWTAVQRKTGRELRLPPPRNSLASLKCPLKTLLNQGLHINLKGWDGEEDGRELQKGGDICIPMADSC